MAATRLCMICGAEYEYCHTNAPQQYRWQDVACCKEHAAQYFAKVAESRGQSLKSIPKEYTDLLGLKKKSVKTEDVVEPTDEETKATDDDTIRYIADYIASKDKTKRKKFSY